MMTADDAADAVSCFAIQPRRRKPPEQGGGRKPVIAYNQPVTREVEDIRGRCERVKPSFPRMIRIAGRKGTGSPLPTDHGPS